MSLISANPAQLANGQSLPRYSNITSTDTKLGSTVLVQVTRDPRGQISNASVGIHCSGDVAVAIDVRYKSGRLVVSSNVPSPRKQRHPTSKVISE